MDKGNIIIILSAFLVMGSLIFTMMITFMPETETPTETLTETPTETPIETPTKIRVVTETPTETPTETTTDNKALWDVCDDRHNASFLYKNGCYGSSGGGSSPNPVTLPIPEIRAFTMLLIGLTGIYLLVVRQK